MSSKRILDETPEQKAYREIIEKIAGNIALLAKAVASLLNGPLNKNALIILLSHSSGCLQRDVTAVLKALEDLEKDWLKK